MIERVLRISKHPRLIWHVSMIMMLAGSRMLPAQTRHDIRISPEIFTTTVVPDSLRYQAACSDGAATLLAFATTRDDGIGGLVGEIRLVRFDSLTTRESVVTSPVARPSGAIALRRFNGSIVLFWNDVRGGSSRIYTRFLDANSVPAGDEIPICDGRFMADSSLWLPDRPDGGHLLIWNDASGRCLYGRVDDALRSLGEAVVLPAPITQVRSIPDLPGALLLAGTASDAAWLLRDDDLVDPRPIPSRLALGSWMIDGDSALVVAGTTSVTKYRSLFDTTMIWSSQIFSLGPDNARIRVLARDGTGRYLLYHTGPFVSYFYMSLRRTAIAGDGRLLDTVLVDSVPYYYPNASGQSYGAFRMLDLDFACGVTTLRLIIDQGFISYQPSHWRTSSTSSAQYIVGHTGTVSRTGALDVQACGQEPRRDVTRTMRGGRNEFAGEGRHLDRGYVHYAGGDRPNSGQVYPSIVRVDGDELIFTYRDTAATAANFIARWRIGSPDTARVVAGESMKGAAMPERPAAPGVTVVQGGASIALVSRFSYIQPVYNDPSRAEIYMYEHTVQVPSDTGWARAYSGVAETSYLLTAAGRIAGNGGALATIDGRGRYYGNQVVICFDVMGRLIWKEEGGDLASIYPVDQIVPIRDTSYVIVSAGRFLLMRGHHLDTLAVIPDQRSGDQYWAYIGGTILRTSRSAGMLRLDLFTPDGMRYYSKEYPCDTTSRDVMVVQRPSDSSIAVVLAGADGVRGYLLDRLLLPLIGDDGVPCVGIRLSETEGRTSRPTAIFHGDSLIVLWEDARNGAADIFGSVVPMPAGGVDTEHGQSIGVSIVANVLVSADVSVIARVQVLRESDVELSLVDVVGRRERWMRLGRLPVGMHLIPVDLRGLAPGRYFIAVASPEGAAAAPILVRR